MVLFYHGWVEPSSSPASASGQHRAVVLGVAPQGSTAVSSGDGSIGSLRRTGDDHSDDGQSEKKTGHGSEEKKDGQHDLGRQIRIPLGSLLGLGLGGGHGWFPFLTLIVWQAVGRKSRVWVIGSADGSGA